MGAEAPRERSVEAVIYSAYRCNVKVGKKKPFLFCLFPFFAQVFQALRIEVNQELEALRDFLKQAVQVLAPGGRLVIISYHSLEDKLVKNLFRAGNFEGVINKDFFGNPIVPLRMITRKALVAGDAELEENSRSRSARLRVAEKI